MPKNWKTKIADDLKARKAFEKAIKIPKGKRPGGRGHGHGPR